MQDFQHFPSSTLFLLLVKFTLLWLEFEEEAAHDFFMIRYLFI